MKRYAAHLTGTAKAHIVSSGLGDWYDIGPPCSTTWFASSAPGLQILRAEGADAVFSAVSGTYRFESRF